MSHRPLVRVLLLSALSAWGMLLLFTRFVPPNTLLAFVAFFVILSVALTSTFALLTYFIGLMYFARYYRATIRLALRQGGLLTLIVEVNLLLRALHSWNVIMAIVIAGAAVVVEVLSLARK